MRPLALAVSLLCASAAIPSPAGGREPPHEGQRARSVLVRGTVLDYQRRTVAGARVSAIDAAPVLTDAQGRFELRVPPGAYVSASKSDLMGHVRLGDAEEQTVVIVMRQMPL